MNAPIKTISWQPYRLTLLDQRYLPNEERYFFCDTVEDVTDAIRLMVVRGAPAIGIAAAYGVALAAKAARQKDSSGWRTRFTADLAALRGARPTAINLCWAIDRMCACLAEVGAPDPVPALVAQAAALHAQDIAANAQMAALGASLLKPASTVITHCNTGALATGGVGTALGVITHAYAKGAIERVFACEARPWLQGARLTMWELKRQKIPASLIIDSAAAFVMQRNSVSWVIVGADRIAANGDVANKIGTYNLAVNARAHGVKFMVVAPTPTVDLAAGDGGDIPIEQRAGDELTHFAGTPVAPSDSEVWNPVFDITPAALIDVIVTERGVVRPPFSTNLPERLNTSV